jgi:hypothetical protein
MEQKAMYVIEETKNNRVYSFSMPMGAPIGEAYDVAFSILEQIVELSKQAVAKAKPVEGNPDQQDGE